MNYHLSFKKNGHTYSTKRVAHSLEERDHLVGLYERMGFSVEVKPVPVKVMK